MKKLIFLIIIISSGNLFCQSIDIEKETKETLDWINSKLTEYQYENSESDVKQLCIFTEVEKLQKEYYLIGIREQVTSKPWASKLTFKIPISKINDITFVEKKHNYWVEIKIKNNEKVIINYTDKYFRDEVGKIEFMLNKNIDNENLQPRMLKAFNYLLKLYGNEKNEKF
jgi:hypothetical protein